MHHLASPSCYQGGCYSTRTRTVPSGTVICGRVVRYDTVRYGTWLYLYDVRAFLRGTSSVHETEFALRYQIISAFDTIIDGCCVALSYHEYLAAGGI